MPSQKEGMIIFRSSVLNVNKASNIKSIDEIPVTNKSAYDILIGEQEAFEFINTVALGKDHAAHPDSYTTVVLTEDWANSFAKVVNEVPKPLFIGGHADTGVGYKERAIPDGYITGAIVKDGTLYLRNTLPLGLTEEKKALVNQTVKEIKAKMLSTSTSDYMRYSIEVDDDTGDVIYFAEESVMGQSNALVEYDMTGSDADIIVTSFKVGDKPINHDKGEHDMGDKITNIELFTSLKNQIDSGRLALSEVAKGLGIDLMTTKQKAALKRLNDAESLVGNITDYVENVRQEKINAFNALKEAKIKETFKTDELIEVATPLFNLKEGTSEDIDKEVSRIAELKVFKTLQGTLASGINFNPANTESEVSAETEAMEG